MGAMRTKGGPKPYYIRRRDSCPISKPSPVKDLGTNTQHEIGWRNLGKEGLFKKKVDRRNSVRTLKLAFVQLSAAFVQLSANWVCPEDDATDAEQSNFRGSYGEPDDGLSGAGVRSIREEFRGGRTAAFFGFRVEFSFLSATRRCDGGFSAGAR